MRKLTLLVLSMILLASCGGNTTEKKDTNVSIEGGGMGLGDKFIKLLTYNGMKEEVMDSVQMKEGQFKLMEKVDKPKLTFLRVDGVPSDLPLILEPGANIKIDIDSNHMRTRNFMNI